MKTNEEFKEALAMAKWGKGQDNDELIIFIEEKDKQHEAELKRTRIETLKEVKSLFRSGNVIFMGKFEAFEKKVLEVEK